LIDAALIMGCSSGFGEAGVQSFLERDQNSITACNRRSTFNVEAAFDCSQIVSRDAPNVESAEATVNNAAYLPTSADLPAGKAGIRSDSRLKMIANEVIRHRF
jgi:NAD(P)-dependent dehydrogenase (short-subunit alcohol dehydrogenase family)